MKHFTQFTSTNNFKQFPDFLIHDSRYNHIPNDAKILYSLFLSRHSLSKKNGWEDAKGVFIIFTREEMASVLNCSLRKVGTLMNQLQLVGLIHEKRQGLNKPNLIYVQGQRLAEKVKTEPESVKMNPQTPTDKGSANFACLDRQNLPVSYIDKSYIDKESIDQPAEHIIKNDKIDKIQNKTIQKGQAIELVKKQINFNKLKESHKQDINLINEFASLIADIYCSRKPVFQIRGDEIPKALVIKQLNKLTYDHMVYILTCFKGTHKKIKNIRSYMLTCLFNAPDTMNTYYQNDKTSYYSPNTKVTNMDTIHYQNERQYSPEQWQEINNLLISC